MRIVKDKNKRSLDVFTNKWFQIKVFVSSIATHYQIDPIIKLRNENQMLKLVQGACS